MDTSYYDSVSQQVNLSTLRQLEGIARLAEEREAISNNDNLNSEVKVSLQILNVVDASLQTFSALTGAAQQLTEAALLPALAALGMQGTACLPITKQMDPVLGIDAHLVMVPPSPAPIPMPHPYIGMLFRAKDFVAAAAASFLPPPPAPPAPTEGPPSDGDQAEMILNKALSVSHTVAKMVIGMIGATVKIGGFIPRVVAGTPTKSIPHFPMGASFCPASTAAIEKDKGHALLGSLLALADNDPIAGGTLHLHNDCWDTGITSPHTFRPSKNTDDDSKMKLQLFLPTGIVTPIPSGGTILTNPVPAPFNPMQMLLKPIKGAFGRLFSKIGHGLINKHVGNPIRAKQLSDRLCTVTGHPVDVASGMFFTDEEDFNLNGPIPLTFERKWFSTSDYQGPLGNGWHHNYDMGILVDPVENNISLRMQDGRPIAFRMPRIETPTFRKNERLEMRVNEQGEYYVWNIDEDVYYYFTDKKYEEVQLLRSIVNANSFSIQFNYNEQGQLTQITDSAHRILNVENNSQGRIIKITTADPDKLIETFALATYAYEANGNMIRQTNAVGDSMYFEYEGNLMVKETWRDGMNWFFRYDGKKIGARCIHTWGDGNIYNHKLTFLDGLTKVENSLGHVTEYYHKDGLVYKQIDPNGAEQQWLYDKDNQLLSKTDPMGNAHLYSYDDFGNRTQVIDPNGAIIETEYYLRSNLPHLPVEAKDANGGIWKWKYDEQGNVIERINPMGASSTMAYNDGLLRTITDALGNATHLWYDGQYNIKEVSDEQGNQTYYKYDRLGRCTKITNPKEALQTRAFDLIGRAIKVDDFDGNHIQLDYDGIDNLVWYKDTQQEVAYSYRGLWKLTRRTDQRGTTYYQYNTEEQLTQIINEKGELYTFTLDEAGIVLQEQSFDDGIKKYDRDLAGRVVQLTKASGKKVHYGYDNASRITEIKYAEDDVHTFEYNPAGQLLKAINNDAEVAFTRNTLGLITTEEVNKHSIQNEYSALGRRTKLQSSLGADINYKHDSFGNLANLSAKHNDTQWEADYNYDRLGFELERHLPGQVTQSFDYDAIGRLTQQRTHKAKQKKHQRRYTWGVNDRLQKVDDSTFGITKYDYTPTGHLNHTKFADGTEQFRTADAVGNLFETSNQTDREYGKGGRLEKKGSWRYKYDTDGFLVEKYKESSGLFRKRKDHWKYEWNAAGMLQTVTRPDKVQVHFTYDSLGRRLSKTFKNTITKWVWDGNVPLHEWKEHVLTGAILSNSAVGDDDTITWVFEENSFIPTAKLKGDKKFSILTDHLGTPSQMYTEEGETAWERSLDSFGRPRNGISSSCPFTYQGQYYDSEIELAYNRFRYYNSEDGCYLNLDPIGLRSGETNFYSYVDNPNWWIDVFGLTPLSYSRIRHDGMTTEQHVRLHEVDNLSKPKHGVFNGDAIDITNDAWANRAGVTPIRQSNGNDIYVIPCSNSGIEGGNAGSGNTLDSVTIITEGGTNNVVTSFPST